jgi:Flp pilus assembly protein TadG
MCGRSIDAMNLLFRKEFVDGLLASPKGKSVVKVFPDLVLLDLERIRPICRRTTHRGQKLSGQMRRFLTNCEGGVAPLLAIGAIPLVVSVGAAVDYSRGNTGRTAMQAALDAAAIMAVKQNVSSSQVAQNVQSYFNANFTRSDVKNLQVSAATAPAVGGTSLSLSATGTLQTEFLSLIGVPSLALSVRSSAYTSTDGLGCVLSLDRSATGATALQGSTAVNLNGCSLYDNSSSPTALSVGGSATLTALSVGVVGGVSGAASINSSNGIKTGIGPLADPYANDSYPNFSGCSQTNFTGKNTATIDPGVYCGGMSFNANANVTLNAGIYYIDGGSLTLNGGAVVRGTGVTLVFTKKSGSSWPTATINGGATLNLTPPTTGPTTGIVMFGDRNMPLGTSFKLTGGSNQYLGGAIYIPNGDQLLRRRRHQHELHADHRRYGFVHR